MAALIVPRVLCRPAVHQRDILLLYLASGELRPQLAMGDIVLGHDDQAAGFFVESMNNARPQLTADIRQRTKAMQQRVDQGAAIALVIRGSRTGVHHHARRLVDDRKVSIFVNDVKRDVFRDGSQRRQHRIAEDRDLLAAAQLQRRLRRRVADQRLLFGD